MSLVESGGGWLIRAFGEFTGSAYCYAGDGCTYTFREPINLLRAETFKDAQVTLQEGSCGVFQLANMTGILPDEEICSVPQEGRAFICRSVSSITFDLLCGEQGVLQMTSNGDTRLIIDEFSISAGELVLQKTIGEDSFSSDSNDCQVTSNDGTLVCLDGWTRLNLFPNSNECQGDSFCGLSCPEDRFKERHGCCPGGRTTCEGPPVATGTPTNEPSGDMALNGSSSPKYKGGPLVAALMLVMNVVAGF